MEEETKKEDVRHFKDLSPEDRAKVEAWVARSVVVAIDFGAKQLNMCPGCIAKVFFTTMIEGMADKVEVVDLDEIAAAAAVKH